jgi:hypothetical protein
VVLIRLIEILLVLCAVTTQTGDLADDTQALWTRPNAVGLAAGGSLATFAHRQQDDWQEELRGAWYIEHPSQITDVYGSSSFLLPAALASQVAGNAANRVLLQRTGRGLTRTLILTQLVVGPIKLAVQRRRPDGSDQYSFPSGHTANTFAIARYVQRDFGTPSSLLPYALAVTTAMGRIEGGRHYLSDVLMGGSLGLIVGSTVHLDEHGSAQQTRLRLVPMSDPASGLRLVLPLH